MAVLLSPEDQAKIAVIRAKNEAGTATAEDFRDFVRTLRQGRLSAHAASETSRRKVAKAAIPSADDLLAQLEKL
jgi:hypothetical protein